MQSKMEVAEGNGDSEINVDNVNIDGNGHWIDGITNSISPNSTQVKIRMLTRSKSSEQESYKHGNSNIPRPFTSPTKHPKHSTGQLDPPH